MKQSKVSKPELGINKTTVQNLGEIPKIEQNQIHGGDKKGITLFPPIC